MKATVERFFGWLRDALRGRRGRILDAVRERGGRTIDVAALEALQRGEAQVTACDLGAPGAHASIGGLTIPRTIKAIKFPDTRPLILKPGYTAIVSASLGGWNDRHVVIVAVSELRGAPACLDFVYLTDASNCWLGLTQVFKFLRPDGTRQDVHLLMGGLS